MRRSVVLFDLDGTLIDSGPIIVASMKHASLTVLGHEPDEELVRAAIGGPGLIAQMRDLDPDRVDELVEAYRAHNEPLHDTLEAFPDVLELLVDGQNARLVPPGDLDAAVEALRALLADTQLRARLSSAARATSEHLTWDTRATKLLAFLEGRLRGEGPCSAAHPVISA